MQVETQRSPETARIGKRGMVVIPQKIRKIMDLQEGDLLLAQMHDGGILLRPAVTLPVEIYSLERKAELLLANAIDPDELLALQAEVRSWGLDPEAFLAP